MNVKVKMLLIASVIIYGCGDSTSNKVSESKDQQEGLEVSKISNDSSMKTSRSNKNSLIEQDKKKIAIESHEQKFTDVTIGGQTWMKHNLNVNKFRNGDIIKQAKSKEDWQQAKKNKEPAWCYYDNDTKNGIIYGKIYNFYAVNDKRELAPKGWHIASKNEFLTLRRNTQEDDLAYYNEQIAMLEDEVKELKNSGFEASVEYLNEEKEFLKQSVRKKGATISMFSKDSKIEGIRGTDLYGFNAMPGGFRDKYGNFKDLGLRATWKCATKDKREKTWGAYITKNYSNKYYAGKEGCYVRCIKNN